MDKNVDVQQDQRLPAESERRLAFSRRLETVLDSIHAASELDDIMFGLSRDICYLFGCDRVTIYTVSERKTEIESRIKVNQDTIKNFRLPISDTSIAGYAALTKRSLNIRDVYDEAELQSHAPNLQFKKNVDLKLNFRTREMLVMPILKKESGELFGVLQLINNRKGGPFPEMIEDGARELCQSLEPLFEQRTQQPSGKIRTKYDPLPLLDLLSRPELELAKRSARRKAMDLEDVLLDEFQVTPEALGAAFAHFFNVPYEPFLANRMRTSQLQNFRREYVEHNEWLVLDESPENLTVLAIDPEGLSGSRAVQALFPKIDIVYRVTTRREFRKTVEQLFAEETAQKPALDPAAVQLARIRRIVEEAFQRNAPDIHITLQIQPENFVHKDGADGASPALQGQATLTFRIDQD